MAIPGTRERQWLGAHCTWGCRSWAHGWRSRPPVATAHMLRMRTTLCLPPPGVFAMRRMSQVALRSESWTFAGRQRRKYQSTCLTRAKWITVPKLETRPHRKSGGPESRWLASRRCPVRCFRKVLSQFRAQFYPLKRRSVWSITAFYFLRMWWEWSR